MKRRNVRFAIGAYFRVAAVLAAIAGQATALRAEAPPPEPAGLAVELNKLEDRGAACRAYLLFENRTGRAYRALKLDLVMFDGDGIVVRRLAVEGAPLADSKTSLRVFDVRDVACADIGRILVNDVLACQGAGGGYDDCLAAIRTTSRSRAKLIK